MLTSSTGSVSHQSLDEETSQNYNIRSLKAPLMSKLLQDESKSPLI